MSIVRVQDLRQQVYDELRHRIMRGAFASDAKFQEIALSEELGVSRTPVREALAMLVRDGLLEPMRRGFRFPKRSPRDVVDIIEVRLRLEPYAVRRMTERLDQLKRSELARTVRAEIAESPDGPGYVEAHVRIREALMAQLGNRILAEAIRQFEDFSHVMRFATLSDPHWREKSISGNLRMIAAIEAGDGDEAEAAQIALLEWARDSFLSHLAETSEDPTD